MFLSQPGFESQFPSTVEGCLLFPSTRTGNCPDIFSRDVYFAEMVTFRFLLQQYVAKAILSSLLRLTTYAQGFGRSLMAYPSRCLVA